MTTKELNTRIDEPTRAESQLIERFAGLPEDSHRARAFEVFERTGLPHRRLEQWKWSDFRAGLKSLSEPEQRSTISLSPSDDAAVLHFDGVRWHVPEELPDGLNVFEKTEGQSLGNVNALPMAALAAGLTGQDERIDVLQVEITKPVDRPIFLDFSYTSAKMAFGRIAFVVREGASVDVIENHTGGAGLSSTITEFGLQKGARATRTLLQTGSRQEATAITASVNLAAEAQYEQTALAFGAQLARIETWLSYTGEEASASLNAAYLPAKGYHVDFTSNVLHGAESCVTRQLTKGAVPEGGRGVFQGKFHVPRTVGQYTDADMQHQALLLDNGAEIFAKPELEIYADDVECAHGNTSGQLDETALFYMRQRGIPLADARALLTEAFIAEALESANVSVREALLEASRDFLRRQNQ
ncbi:SufD family Fe-S cluster assembly protein [Henriciella sp.]|uniref:SufB/SufD family protein n=1 Tax=Henriciella sp. TaxID=1968823 RepID=UPI002633E4BC|nr:SufD family Fe-S cluster assembly protein [Henriciella sp.]